VDSGLGKRLQSLRAELGAARVAQADVGGAIARHRGNHYANRRVIVGHGGGVCSSPIGNLPSMTNSASSALLVFWSPCPGFTVAFAFVRRSAFWDRPTSSIALDCPLLVRFAYCVLLGVERRSRLEVAFFLATAARFLPAPMSQH
jgi:hypothetical protein